MRSSARWKPAGALELECLTLYAFSSENWKRDEAEISDLMSLMRRFIEANLKDMIEQGVRLKLIGDYKAFAPDIVAKLEDALERTAGGERTLAVALNYGAQQEIVRAAATGGGGGRSDLRGAGKAPVSPPTCRRSTC